MRKYHKISIIGPKKFTEQTIKSLKLIKIKSKKDFKKIIKYLKTIKYSKHSGMILDKSQFNVGKRTAFHSIEWYASCIVHDLHHYYLNNVKKFLWEKINFKKHEELCLKEQIRFLKRIKAPKSMIQHCNDVIKTKWWEMKNIKW